LLCVKCSIHLWFYSGWTLIWIHRGYSVNALFSNILTRATPYVFWYWTLGISIPMVILGVIASNKILPKAEKMKTPMLLNIIILVIMGVVSTFLFSPFALKGVITLVVGIFIYMFSVLIYAWHNYVQPVPFERLIKMSTYLIGLFLIVQGFMWAICGC
ncbi:MAG: lysoplasmalogenase family protein, partial [Candidatus Heimdallarchaeota archaeon]